MKIRAAILDWAGTVVDHGSRAPMGAFVRAFAECGVEITIADARGPMGMAKRDHIRMVGQLPAVAAAWQARHGRAFGEFISTGIRPTFMDRLEYAGYHLSPDIFRQRVLLKD